MPVVLYRVDDRLVHGQVVVGWGGPLRVERIMLVDATVAASSWEQDLYRMGVPPGVELAFAGPREAALLAPLWRADPRHSIVLTPDVATMATFCELAAPVPAVNLGGIHLKPGRTERLPYVSLSDEEYRTLGMLAARGTEVTAQDLPTSRAIPLEELR